MVTDPDAFPKLQAYLQDMVKTFRKDKRIIMWDLYNEPANAPHGDKCIELVKNAFQWARDWFDINFPDADWQTGNAPFGKEEMSIWRNPNTEWLSKAIWLRTTFDLTDEQLNSADKIILLTHYDDDTYIYINGHLAVELPGYNAIYEEIELSPEAIQLLKPGTNTIAVSVINNWGGQFFDMGLVKQILQE